MQDVYKLSIITNLPRKEQLSSNNDVVVYDEVVIVCDVVSNFSSNESSEITSHPIVTGDIVADHMYRMPISCSVSGSFSMYGDGSFTYTGSHQDRLANIQQLFRRIKNEGLECTLIKSTSGKNGSSRFMSYDHMVLKDIDMTTNNTDLDFTFRFVEVMTIDVITEPIPDEDVLDENLPAITDAVLSNFSDTMINWEDVDAAVIKAMQSIGLFGVSVQVYDYYTDKYGLINQRLVDSNGIILTNGTEFLNIVSSYCSSEDFGNIILQSLAGTAVGAIAGVVISYLVGCLSNPVGLVVIAVSAIVGFVVSLVFSIMKAKKRREYKIATFAAYLDDRKNQSEVIRFVNFVGQIHLNIMQLNDVIHFYQIPTNEYQEMLLTIDNNYYTFKFSKNNTSDKNSSGWSLEVTDMNGKPVSGASMSNLVGKTEMSECRDGTQLFRVPSSGSYVYIIFLYQSKYSRQLSNYMELSGYKDDDYYEAIKDLRNYAVMVSEINLSNYEETLAALIDEGLKL